MRERQSIFVLVFLLISSLPSSFAYCFQEALFRKETGVFLAGHTLKTEVESSEIECCGQCLEDASCMSVNYKIAGDHQGLCELNANIFEDFPQDRKQDYDYCYFQKFEAQVINEDTIT